MALKKSAARRLGLLAGSSLVAASLGAAAFTGVAIAPSAALAYDECAPANPPTTQTDGADGVSDPTLNGATADAFTCAGTTYATGVTYSSSGALTVTKSGATAMAVTANGVNLSGSGTDSVTWDSSAGVVSGGAGTAGPVIDVTSASSAISITTNGVTATQAGTTHAIRATSTGGGNITITRAAGAVNNNVAGGLAAIQAVTNGGNISVTTAGNTQGRLRGILAQTSGAGSVNLTLGGNVSASNIDGVAAIDATAGTGGLNITMNSGTVAGGTAGGWAIEGTSAGNAVINNVGGTLGGLSFNMPAGGGAVDFSGVAGNVTMTHAGGTTTTGRWLASGDSVFGAGNDTVNLSGVAQNFLGGTGALAEASIDFGAGDDTLNLAATLNMGAFTQDAGVIDFGAGADTFNLSGLFMSNGGTLANLEALNLSGVIYMGTGTTGGNNPNVVWDRTDEVADDVLRVHGATLTGSGSARIVMDIMLGQSQAGCATIASADCLDLSGGATAGVTTLSLHNLTPDAQLAGFDPVGITLVDVAGGTSAAGHFVLDPDMPGMVDDPLIGAAIDRPGLFRYALRYDADNQRHVIVGLPRGEVLQYVMLPSAARSVWYMTSDTITDRQTDLRAGTEGTVWVRASGQYSKTDASTGFENLGQAFAVDGSYKLYAGTIIGGMDLIAGTSGGYDYVLGAQLGYVGSSFDLDASESSGRFTGATGGVYGGVWTSRFFLDATFNTNFLTLDYDNPVLGAKTNTWLRSVGAQAEGGMRYMLGERTYLEPLAAAAFVYTTFEEISLFGGEVQPDDAHSRRAALGLRLGADLPGQSVNWSYFLTGRAWNEFDGEVEATVHNPGVDLVFGDELSGTFSEFEAGVGLANDAGTLSGFVTSGVKAQDGYSAIDLATGVRLRW